MSLWGPKVTITDKLLAKTILIFIPSSVTPNQVTIFRFLATPFVIWLILIENYKWAMPLFLIAALTDAIDGAMARTRDQITEWGKIYDPLADKLLIGSIAFLLISKYLNLYLALAIIFPELLLISLGGLRRKNKQIIEANWWGKSKMILQVAGSLLLFFYLLWPHNILINLAWFIFPIAIVLAIISLLTYSI
ncbi:MAG: CDP-alcohol phosphatidyltransferase family protein [bacterium]